MKKLITKLALIAVSFSATEMFSAEMLAVAQLKVGDVVYVRGAKEAPVTKGMILEKNDKIITRNGTLNLQVGANSIIHLSKNTAVLLSDLTEQKDSQKVELNLSSGSILTKITKKLDKSSEFKITSPTMVASVRGTQFLIQENADTESNSKDKKIEPGVYVSEGTVDLKTDYSKNSILVQAGQELVTSQKKLQAEILNEFAREKLKILSTLDVMNEINYRQLREQQEKNRALLKK